MLVEANGLFLSDILGVGMTLQRAFRQGYSLDSRNSTITAVRGSKDLTVIETLNHFYTGSVAVAQPGNAGPAPGAPRYLPDARSLFLSFAYNVAGIPLAAGVLYPFFGLLLSPVVCAGWAVMFALGIPPNAVMALMIGAMIIHGIQPGPQIMTAKPDLFWGMIASMWVGNLLLVREFLELARTSADFAAYRRRAVAAHRQRFGADCHPNICYYPELMPESPWRDE